MNKTNPDPSYTDPSAFAPKGLLPDGSTVWWDVEGLPTTGVTVPAGTQDCPNHKWPTQPPHVVKLEDIKVLTDALQELVNRDTYLLMPYSKIAHKALKTFLTTYPQLNS